MHLNPLLVEDIDSRLRVKQSYDMKSLEHTYIPYATAPSILPVTSSEHFYEMNSIHNNNKFQKFIMEGKYTDKFKEWKELDNWKGFLHQSPSLTYIQVIDFGSLIGDSSKLKELDLILKEKKRNGDKVLIFCQMTKMLDIL